MKQALWGTPEKQELAISRMRQVIAWMDRVECEGEYAVSDMGSACIRVFIYPENYGPAFTAEQARKIRSAVNEVFGTKKWQREMLAGRGAPSWTVEMPDYFGPLTKLIFFVERNEIPRNCKLIEEQVTKTVFKMECAK